MKTIFLILLAFSLPLSAQSRLIDGTAALVNDKVITFSDINEFRKKINLRRELDPFVAFFQADPKSKNEIIDFLIQEELIVKHFQSSKSEIEAEIQNILKNNGITIERLAEVLNSQGIQFEDYRKLMAISLSKRKLMDRELRPLSIVTDDEIKNFYYTAPEFEAQRSKKTLLLSYDLSQMIINGKKLATSISDRLSNGEDFDSLASSLSNQNVETIQLGQIREDSIAVPIKKALKGLEVGKATQAFLLNENQYTIIRINQISAPKDPLFETYKNQIRALLYQRAMKNQLVLWTTRIKTKSYTLIPN